MWRDEGEDLSIQKSSIWFRLVWDFSLKRISSSCMFVTLKCFTPIIKWDRWGEEPNQQFSHDDFTMWIAALLRMTTCPPPQPPSAAIRHLCNCQWEFSFSSWWNCFDCPHQRHPPHSTSIISVNSHSNVTDLQNTRNQSGKKVFTQYLGCFWWKQTKNTFRNRRIYSEKWWFVGFKFWKRLFVMFRVLVVSYQTVVQL